MMSKIEELKKWRKDVLQHWTDEAMEEIKLIDYAKVKRSMMNLDFACIEFIDDEIRLEELVYFCQNGVYPQ
jgi:hypothetical protein